MIPVQSLSLEEDIGDDGEDDKRYAFLYHLELDQIKWSSIIYKTDAVGWYLTAIFEEGDGPPIRGQLLLTPVCCNLRCPYQASVMKMLLSTNNNIVYNPFIILSFLRVQR